MKKDLLIYDLDDTLADGAGFFDGVPALLQAQARFRECVIATTASKVVEREISAIRNSISGFYPREIISRAYEFQLDDSGKLIKNTRGSIGSVEQRNSQFVYKNPYIPGWTRKDLFLAKLIHEQNTNQVFPNRVFVSDVNDLDVLSSDPSTPGVIVEDSNWVERGAIQEMTEKLFRQKPSVVFDEMFWQGAVQSDRAVRVNKSWLASQDSYREVKLAECREVRLGDANFLLARRANSLKVRAVLELGK